MTVTPPSTVGARPRSRARHRSWLRRRSGAWITIVVSLAVAASTWVWDAATTAGTGLSTDPAQTVRHSLVALALALAVIGQGGVLRRGQRPVAAAVLPWLVAGVPVVVGSVTAMSPLASGPTDSLTGVEAIRLTWLVATHPGWVALIALLATDGIRSTWRPRPLVLTALSLLAIGILAWALPGPARHLAGTEIGPLRAVVAGMIICAAMVATAPMPVSRRLGRILMLGLAPSAIVALPALVDGSLDTAQRWAVVSYPLAALAAGSPGLILTTLSDLWCARHHSHSGERSPRDQHSCTRWNNQPLA